MNKIPDDECSDCGAPRTVGKYKRTGFCDGCLELKSKKGWKPQLNGVMKKGEIQLLPSGKVKIEDHPNDKTVALLRGDISVEDLDAEEISYGMCKNEDGSFPLKRPGIVPKSIYDKMQQQLYKIVHEEMNKALIDSVHAIRSLLEDPDPAMRFRSATWLIERVMGKTPDVVTINQERPWEIILDKVSRKQPLVIEGEVEDD